MQRVRIHVGTCVWALCTTGPCHTDGMVSTDPLGKAWEVRLISRRAAYNINIHNGNLTQDVYKHLCPFPPTNCDLDL